MLRYKIYNLRLKLCIKRIFIPSLFAILIAFCFPFPIRYLEASPPAIGSNEILDGQLDWINLENKEPTMGGNAFTDIISINYYSSGSFLNATMWLGAPFKENFSNPVIYGIWVDADSNNQTGVGGVDYELEITGQYGNWMRQFTQYSSFGFNKTLSQPNITDFFVNNGNYVNLDLDLAEVGSPERYKVIFYTMQNNQSQWVMDVVIPLYLPKPSFELSPAMNPLDVRAGESKSVEIQVKSTPGLKPTIHLEPKNDPAINAEFSKEKLVVPTYGMESTNLNIHVPGDAAIKQYTIAVFGKAIFPTERIALPGKEISGEINRIALRTEDVSKYTTLTVNVAPAANQMDKILEIMDKSEGVIAFLGGVVTGNIGSWVYKKVREKKGAKG